MLGEIFFFLLVVLCFVEVRSPYVFIAGSHSLPFCILGWPQTHRHPLASVSWALRLKVCATNPKYVRNFSFTHLNVYLKLTHSFFLYLCFPPFYSGVWFFVLVCFLRINFSAPVNEKKEHVLLVFLSLPYFFWHCDLELHSHCCEWQHFIVLLTE